MTPTYILSQPAENQTQRAINILKEVRGGRENHFIYKGTKVRIIVGISSKTKQAR